MSLFIPRGDKIISGEGTTQGDPAATATCALGSLPLLDAVSTQRTKHAAYSNDLNCAGKTLVYGGIKQTILVPKLAIF